MNKQREFHASIAVVVRAGSEEAAAELVLQAIHSGEVLALLEKYGLCEPTLEDDGVCEPWESAHATLSP